MRSTRRCSISDARGLALALIATLALGTVSGAAVAGIGDDESAVLLVARPDMRDPEFAQTVVLVAFPQDAGPMGVILNRPAGVAIGEVLRERADVRERRDPMFLGGPLEQDGLLFVFHAPQHPVRALPLLDDLYLSGDGAIFDTLMAAPDDAAHQRFYVGHSGWEEGQLDEEIEAGDWYVLPVDAAAIFEIAPDRLWDTLIARAKLPSALLQRQRHLARTTP